MLTIQPNFSQRFHSQPLFKGKYDNAEYVEDVEYVEAEEVPAADEFTNSNPGNLPVLASTYNSAPKDNTPEPTLEDVKEGLDGAVSDIKKIGENMPTPIKKGINVLCLVGGGAAIGVGTKLGWNEAGNVITKVWKSPAVIKFRKNMDKIGKKIANCFADLKETKFYKSITKKFSDLGNSFADTKFGKKVCGFFKKINESKPVVAVKNLFGKAKKANAAQISDTTGDVVAFSTGASTTVAGAIPEKKKDAEADKNKEAVVENSDAVTSDEDEDNVIVD